MQLKQIKKKVNEQFQMLSDRLTKILNELEIPDLGWMADHHGYFLGYQNGMLVWSFSPSGRPDIKKASSMLDASIKDKAMMLHGKDNIFSKAGMSIMMAASEETEQKSH